MLGWLGCMGVFEHAPKSRAMSRQEMQNFMSRLDYKNNGFAIKEIE
jgi:hypothetical protein